MLETEERFFTNFEDVFKEFKSVSPLTKPQLANKLASQIDLLSQSPKGLKFLFDKSLELEFAGFFQGTAWEHPRKQVPSLVRGTLMSGHPTSSFEIMSELRILAYASGMPGNGTISQAEARSFLEEVAVHNLEFAFDELREESRMRLTQQERRKIVMHFRFMLEKANLTGVKDKLAEEIWMVCEQRPIVTKSIRNLLQTIYHKMDLDSGSPVDKRLQYFVNAIYFPGSLVKQRPNFIQYKEYLKRASEEELKAEAVSMGKYLHDTGLSNPYLAMMLRYILQHEPQLLPDLLHLGSKGSEEWERYTEFITDLALTTFHEYNYRGIYGLKRMLERNLFYRRPVRAGLTNLKLISLHPQVKERLHATEENSVFHNGTTDKQLLIGALISILGQPLGVGQGNNPTCQSARGISMWAQHAPAKLINMITTIATANNLIMRFEESDLESLKLTKGLVEQLDPQLDAVSAMLVPHLDKIYGEMMRRASGRGDDPHKWVNPALYGHWVPTSFASPYSYLFNAIVDYKNFVRLFYASFHPAYNGGRQMVYPNPVGLFITTSRGDMLGFHAVSLLRISNKNDSGETRAYFLNPNNEGRQNWGQGIRPSVAGNGEKHGESSLPVNQFLARVYAFHYNSLYTEVYIDKVPESEVEEIQRLAKESWGKNYQWTNTPASAI